MVMGLSLQLMESQVIVMIQMLLLDYVLIAHVMIGVDKDVYGKMVLLLFGGKVGGTAHKMVDKYVVLLK